MAEAAISAALLKLGELAVSESKLLLQVGDDIVLLRDRLEWLQAFVRNADRKRRAGTDGLTRVWVHQTRTVAFDAEDALDDFFYEQVVDLKGQGCRRRWKTLRKRYITGVFRKIIIRRGLSGRIKVIKSRLDQISENQKEYKIVHAPSVVLASSTTAIAAWRDDLENAVGFDQDVDIIKRMLRGSEHIGPHDLVPISVAGEIIQERADGRSIGNNKHPMFISIVGESGVGKNTLAKIIDRQMRPEMKFIIWYHMKPSSSMVDLLREVYLRAYHQCHRDCRYDKEMIKDDDIGEKLHELLDGERYLLILSGISSKNILNCVRAVLPDPGEGKNNGGCVILILDTENEEVAWHANTMNRNGINAVHMLTRLDQERSGKLFFWKVMRKSQEGISRMGSLNDDKRYEEVVYRITGGYPMAIVLLAGLLRFKEKPVQWESMLQHLQSEFPQPQDKNSRYTRFRRESNHMCTRRAMEIIFWASFEDLPNDLKSCFLYFAAYPNDTRQYADEIVRMWIGEGFIKPQNKKSMEEVGHDYLKELVLRCLVEVEEMKPGGGIQFVRIQKCIKGFLQLEVRESGFMEIHNIHGVLVSPSVRRLSIRSDNGRRYTATFTNNKFHKLRSFICHIIGDQHNHPQDLKLLWRSRFIRVISVRKLRLEKLPRRIGDMIHLRYLRIESKSLWKLPSSIARLLNLETLDIRTSKVTKVHKDFWKIKTLRHVLATNLMLPKKMPITGDKGGVGGGSELQTLHGVMPAASGEWSVGNCPLDKMANLRSLEMHGFIYEPHSKPGFEAAIMNMKHLGHLYLGGDEIPSCVFTEPKLLSLETMVLHGKVNWKGITGKLLRKVRPNLLQLKLNNISEVPEDVKQQLGTILVEEGENCI